MVLHPLCRLFFCSFLSMLCFASKAVRNKWVVSSTDSELGRFASPASSFEQKTRATSSTWATIAMSLAGFLCRCAVLIRPKKEKDYVDPTSLPASSNNLAAMHTSWCRSGASGCGLLALVYHSSTTPETQSGYRGIRLQSLHCISRALLGRLCSKFCRPGVRVRTYLHHRGVDGVSHLFYLFYPVNPQSASACFYDMITDFPQPTGTGVDFGCPRASTDRYWHL